MFARIPYRHCATMCSLIISVSTSHGRSCHGLRPSYKMYVNQAIYRSMTLFAYAALDCSRDNIPVDGSQDISRLRSENDTVEQSQQISQQSDNGTVEASQQISQLSDKRTVEASQQISQQSENATVKEIQQSSQLHELHDEEELRQDCTHQFSGIVVDLTEL